MAAFPQHRIASLRLLAVFTGLALACMLAIVPAWAQDSDEGGVDVQVQSQAVKAVDPAADPDLDPTDEPSVASEVNESTSASASESTESADEELAADDGDQLDGTDQAGTSPTTASVVDSSTTQSTSEGTVTLTAASATSGSLDGIDISHWDEGINIAKTSGDFVIVKATQGMDFTDPCFKAFADATLKAGKLLGIYHFADGSVGARREARYFLKTIKGYLGKAVLFLDWEDSGSTSALAAGPSYAKKWLDYVYQQTGIKPLIYMSQSVTTSYDWSSVKDAGYGLWLARYMNKNANKTGYLTPSITDATAGYWGYPKLYQYSSTGRIVGYSGDLDVNKFYGTAADWQALAKGSGSGTLITFSTSKTVGGVKYRISDGNAIVVSADKTLTSAVIRNAVTIDGVRYKVVKIRKSAFANCDKLKSVSIGRNVTVIGENAFYRNASLASITGGARVKTIKKYAFRLCTGLKKLAIGSKVTTIGYGAFAKCSALVEVTGGKNVVSFGTYAFSRCGRLRSFTVTSKRLRKLGVRMFYKDGKLKVVALPKTTKLTRGGVRRSLKGSSVKTVKVAAGRKTVYGSYFKKANSGRKVTVKSA